MKKILLLGGSAQQIVAIKTAKRLGYYTILCDYLPDNPGQFYADKFYLKSTTDKNAIFSIAQEEKIDGILAYASDPAAPTAAYVAEIMGLAGNPYNSVEILCNKDLFRKFLTEQGFNVPKMLAFSKLSDVSKESFEEAGLEWPIIVKPVDSSGSKGATVLYSSTGLTDAAEFAFSFSRSHRIIAEEYIEKKHRYLVGGDIFVIDGKVCLWGLLNCHRDQEVNPLVPVGKSYPLELKLSDVELAKKTLTKLVDALKMRNGAMNVELIIDKKDRAWLIDVGPRSGGNMIPDLMSDMFGVDIAELSVQAAMGEKIVLKPHDPEGCYATHNLHSNRDGGYIDIRFDEKLEEHIYRKCLYKKAGESVEFFDNAAKCLGIIFMKFENIGDMDDILSVINSHIVIELSTPNGGGIRLDSIYLYAAEYYASFGRCAA